MSRLHVAGLALGGSGYPNATQTVRALRESAAWQVEDHAVWLPEGMHLWRIARGPFLARLLFAMRLMSGNGLALLRLTRVLRRRPGLTYVPYPAAFLLWWASFVPARWRPRIVADAYISLWDSAFRDRAVLGHGCGGGIAGRLAKAFERRALKAAQFVLVDTTANRDVMITEFSLEPSRVFAVPLAVDVAPLRRASAPQQQGSDAMLRVLFVGTLIPLHGIGVVAETIRLAGPDAGISFHIVGDGQESAAMEALMASQERAHVVWERGWKGLEDIARCVAEADVCLGVFGGAGKAARVLPFKLYIALAAGKAIVTQAQYSLPAGVPPLPAKTVTPVPAVLLQALLALKADPAERQRLSSEAAGYYSRWLDCEALRLAWRAIAERAAQ